MIQKVFDDAGMRIVLYGEVEVGDVVLLEKLASASASYYHFAELAIEVRSARARRSCASMLRDTIERIRRGGVTVNITRTGRCGTNMLLACGEEMPLTTRPQPRSIGFRASENLSMDNFRRGGMN